MSTSLSTLSTHTIKSLIIPVLVVLLTGLLWGCGSDSSSRTTDSRSQQTSTSETSDTSDTNVESDPPATDVTDRDQDISNPNAQRVSVLQGQLNSPLSSQFPNLPNECNNVQFLHHTPVYDTNNQPYARQTRDADTIYFFMPGLLAGAGAFNYLAEQLILEASIQNLAVEVIVLDRRDQCFRDLAGLEAAEAERNIQLAINYYYQNASIQGQQFSGIKSSDDLPWLADMGLSLVQQDLMSVLLHLVPDPVQRQQKVFVGGHSLGGLLTHSFAGWDFDSDINTTDDAGYNQAAGFIRLDIDVTPLDEQLDEHLLYGSNGFIADPNDKANQQYQKEIDALTSGKSSRIMEMPGLNTEAFFLVEMAAMLAHWAPHDEATLINELPIGSTTNLLLRLIHSKSLGNFISNNPGIRDFRYTNEAILGVIFDDDFMPVGILQTSLGTLAGGTVKTKSFPINPTLTSIVDFLVPDLGNLLTTEQLYIPTERKTRSEDDSPLYTWVNFDAIDDQVHTQTTEEEEVTDMALFAESIYKGPGTFTEWYMSARVGLELDAISKKTSIQGLNYWHAKAARSKPLLEIVGSKGLPTLTPDISPLGTLVVADGYNHVDLLSASNHHKTRRPNEVIEPILQFAKRHQP